MIRPPSRERSVYTIRLGAAERRLLEAAAACRSQYLAEFIRGSALEAARREIALPAIRRQLLTAVPE
jgi:uncharacterized protein (DUF1778 family)